MADDDVGIYRTEVAAILGALADIHVWTRQLLDILRDDDEEEEEDS